MNTWSIADAIDDAKAITKYVASLALTPVLELVYPPLGHDDDRPVDGAEGLAEREAEEEVHEPLDMHPDAVYGREYVRQARERERGKPSGRYSVHIEDGQPYQFGRDIKVGEQHCAICGELLSAGFHTCPVLAAQRSADDTPNPTEPGLTDDELVAVRGLIQERYFDAAEAVMERVVVPEVKAARWERRIRNGSPQSVPASSAAGASPSGVDSFPPNPPEGPLSFVNWAVPAILTVLEDHYIERPTGLCRCGDCDTFDLAGWREHVAPLIAAHVEKALLATDFGK
jgi:hypothetical protein